QRGAIREHVLFDIEGHGLATEEPRHVTREGPSSPPPGPPPGTARTAPHGTRVVSHVHDILGWTAEKVWTSTGGGCFSGRCRRRSSAAYKEEDGDTGSVPRPHHS